MFLLIIIDSKQKKHELNHQDPFMLSVNPAIQKSDTSKLRPADAESPIFAADSSS